MKELSLSTINDMGSSLSAAEAQKWLLLMQGIKTEFRFQNSGLLKILVFNENTGYMANMNIYYIYLIL